MKQVTVIQKLEKLAKKRKTKLVNALDLTYKMNSNRFENYNKTCGIDMDTLDGHSYGWYSLVKKIKGKVILNNYSYSNMTAKHVYKMRYVLHDLGIKFETLEAPRGLQNVEEMKARQAYLLAEAIVSERFARKDNKASYKQRIKTLTKKISLMRSLGMPVSQARIDSMIQVVENEREVRLEKQREKAARNRAKVVASLLVSLVESSVQTGV